jgi:tetratricopeptide (TPR) repeat protein
MPCTAAHQIVTVAALITGLLAITPALAQGDGLQEANQLFKQKQFDRALDRVNAYLKTQPKDARGRFLKGMILADQNKPNDAITVFTELTQDFPELPEPYNNLAVLYASQGQYDKARSALEMAIRAHPNYATAHENLGDIYAKMAGQAYDKALQLDRGNAAAQTKLNLIQKLFPDSPRPAKPAAAMTPAAVATTRSAPAGESAQDPDAVLIAVTGWAKAWSDNDVSGYLAHYASDFQTPGGMSRDDWESQRKARMVKPRRIAVEIESPKVSFNKDGRVTVTFHQHYRSDELKVTSAKTLVMVKAGDKWLIQQERAGS